MPAKPKFENNPNLRPKNPHRDSPTKPEPYVVAPELKKAVNLALYLRRPLLLEGEAGCGKTRLASAVSYELGLPLYRWDVRSTTKAQDGLYKYDAILRLHDVQTQKIEQDRPINQTENAIRKRNPANPRDYREFGALGKAFTLDDRSAVVLIDEIDKADLDFPNDLLTVLDEPWEFKIKETGETVTAKHKPIVMITSNKEKGKLPDPFLRRCLYHYVDFPKKDELLEIVEQHFPTSEKKAKNADLKNMAIERFVNLRNEGGLFKKPGTSEFLDWLRALITFESEPYKAAQLEKDNLLPYPELLFKLPQDWKKHTKAS